MIGFAWRSAVLVALGVVDYRLAGPWRLVVLVIIMLYLWQWMALHHRRQTIYIIRQRRHRLANRLQLVTGWFQLGASAKAEDALGAMVESEADQSLWFRGLPSRWSYLFLRWDARAEERGTIIRWEQLDHLEPTHRAAWMLEWRLSQAMRVANSEIIVRFLPTEFYIYVAQSEPFRRPWGWRKLRDGVEYRYRVKKRGTTSGTSIPT